MSKRYDVLHILARAEALGIELAAIDGNIHVRAPAGVITPNILQVLREYKTELVRVLTPNCATCLDAGKESIGTFEIDGLMYCAGHRPGQQKPEDNPVVQSLLKQFGGTLHPMPPGYTLADRVRERNAANRERERTQAKQVHQRRSSGK